MLVPRNSSPSLRIAESSRDWQPQFLDVVAVVFVTALLVSNLAAQKIFIMGPFVFTAGILIFPISYIFGDILTEVYGIRRAKRVIYMGLAANLFMAFMLWIAILLPPAPGWNLQQSFKEVHSLVPRIVLASSIGYLIGELVNSQIMSRLKILFSGKKLWIRINLSTLGGQFFDSFLFALIGFFGVIPNNLLFGVAVSAWLFKSIYEALATPITYILVRKLKLLEGTEHFDLKESTFFF
jgi:uncharacterized integral membrane protein (TIGR00697 family)